MDVILKPVERDDVLPLLQLRVAPTQQEFIVHNALTLAQAAYEPNTSIFGIWARGAPVGLTTVIDMRRYPYADQSCHQHSAYIWRLMIGDVHQGKGYGRAALEALAGWAEARGLRQVLIATVQTNIGALRLYRALGFRPTGRMAQGEMELALQLTGSDHQRKIA